MGPEVLPPKCALCSGKYSTPSRAKGQSLEIIIIEVALKDHSGGGGGGGVGGGDSGGEGDTSKR